MNRIIAALAATGAIVAAAPPAHADGYTSPYLAGEHYVSDLAQAGVPLGTPAQEVYVAQLICGNLSNGMTSLTAANRLINAGVGTDVAVAIVGLAIIDVCPQFAPVPANHVPSPATPSIAPVPVTIASAVQGALA